MNLRKFAQALWKDDRGQSTTEYILILAVVVMIAMKFKSVFKEKLEGAVTTLGNKVGETVNEVTNE